jgi:hypothetical protein
MCQDICMSTTILIMFQFLHPTCTRARSTRLKWRSTKGTKDLLLQPSTTKDTLITRTTKELHLATTIQGMAILCTILSTCLCQRMVNICLQRKDTKVQGLINRREKSMTKLLTITQCTIPGPTPTTCHPQSNLRLLLAILSKTQKKGQNSYWLLLLQQAEKAKIQTQTSRTMVIPILTYPFRCTCIPRPIIQCKMSLHMECLPHGIPCIPL